MLSSGIMCDVYHNDQRINVINNSFSVVTMRMIFSDHHLLPETFIHFKGKDSLIRELQVLKFENSCVLLAKLGRAAKAATPSDAERSLYGLVKKYFDVTINRVPISYFRYENSRRYFDISESQYAKTPIIIPARIFSDSQADENIISQDISRSFFDLSLVNSVIVKKFT